MRDRAFGANRRLRLSPRVCVCVCYFLGGKTREKLVRRPRSVAMAVQQVGGGRNRLGRRVRRAVCVEDTVRGGVSGPSPFERDGLHEDIIQYTHTQRGNRRWFNDDEKNGTREDGRNGEKS